VPPAGFLGIQRWVGVPRVFCLEEGRWFLVACDALACPRSSPRRGPGAQDAPCGAVSDRVARVGVPALAALADVDLERAVLRSRDTKFGKSRLVPLADDVTAGLHRYRRTVAAEHGERLASDPFFPARSGQPYSLSALRAALHAALAATQIPRWPGGQPLRLQDSTFVCRPSADTLVPPAHPAREPPAGARDSPGPRRHPSSQRYLQLTEDHVAEITRCHATWFGT